MNKINPRSKALVQNIYFKLFISSMIAIFFGNLGQIVGSMIVGFAVSGQKLAVISLALPIYYVFATIGNMAGIGGSTLSAKYLGLGEKEKCNKAYTVTYLFTIILSFIFAFLIIILLPFLVPLLGAGAELYNDLYAYSLTMAIGGVFIALAYLSFNFLRLDGNAFATTMSFVVMASINILFDFVLLILFPIGVVGVSAATCIGAASSSLLGYLYIRKKSRSILAVRILKKDFVTIVPDILKLGSPGAVENAAILLRSFFLNRIILLFATEITLSSLAVINSINSFAQGIIAGAAGALVPLFGVFYGEKDNENIRRIELSAYLSGGIFLAVFSGIIFAFAPAVSLLFGMSSTPGTVFAIRLFCVSLPFCFVANMMIYSHIADGHSAIASLMTLLRNFVMSLAAAFVLMKFYGENGLWLSYSVCEVITVAVGLICHLVIVLKHRNFSFFMLLDKNIDRESVCFECNVVNYSENLSLLSEKITDFCDKMEMMPKQTMLINLAVEELLVAIAMHTPNKAIERTVSIRLLVYREIIVLRLRYAGELFNPIKHYEMQKDGTNDVESLLSLEDSLGIKMIIDTCESVDYRLTFGINNLTVIL